MKYAKFSPEEVEKLSDGLWSLGHTDLGTITLLFRQPVAALQIRDHETGEWKWAKPLDGSLTVNTCDALSFLTGGYIKSTVHRVSSLVSGRLMYADNSRYRFLQRISVMLTAWDSSTLPALRMTSLSKQSTLQSSSGKVTCKTNSKLEDTLCQQWASSLSESRSGNSARVRRTRMALARKLCQASRVNTMPRSVSVGVSVTAASYSGICVQ